MTSKQPKRADTTAEKQRVVGRPFKKGPEWNGNAAGRPKGSRNKLTEDFLSAMAEDFEQHGKAAIVEVRENDPSKYLTVVAQLVPKEADIKVSGSAAFERIWRLIGEGVGATLPDETVNDDADAYH